MTTPLTGSRYEFHITRQGAGQNKAAKSYHDLYAADEDKSFNKSDDIVGHIHSIDVGSTVDGPGIRFVLFTTGCPLRCVYCHNPDTWHKANGRPVSINRIMKEIGKYEKGLRISKGGITLSGGEPLMQHDFSAEIFRRCKALGIHTCLDTSGYMSERLSDEELRNIDLVLLDINLPLLDGFQVLTKLRQTHPSMPVIMLTARGHEDDRIRGLETGADDYVTKPFSPRELVARVSAVLRRVRPALAGEVITVGDLELDPTAHKVTRNGQTMKLGPTEFRLLRHFMEHPGRVFSRGQLLDAVWGNDSDIELRTVDVHIRRLRQGLALPDTPDPVRTVRSAGYALEKV